jgi:hypothetical protein
MLLRYEKERKKNIMMMAQVVRYHTYRREGEAPEEAPPVKPE